MYNQEKDVVEIIVKERKNEALTCHMGSYL